ncbi:MAG: TetR/AcrR family transcriptional regulator C-terminal domain-containing protein [Oscillospiraceae bacterium]|nr:TetR/AcrR family transcriptional regulator C-terminal domain-containing protein [Oscillospiraceae bacterium]MCR4759388.1 TetR/AcrR family transcriptional regulator C-terminal domain-containing protein [Oscillospiraceae bacterium]
MAIRDATKSMFAQALDELLRTTPLQKVSVKALCLQCGAERQTFYYHFKDKYDLAAWMLSREWEGVLERFGGKFCPEQLAAYLDCVRAHQIFYKRLYADETSSLLPKFLFQQETERVRLLLLSRLGLSRLSETQEFAVIYHVNGCIGSAIAWARTGFRMPPEQVAALHYSMLDVLVREAGRL